MTDTDLLQPDPGPLRAAAEAAELARAVSGLVSIHGCRLADGDPLAPLARDITRSMTKAALTVHHCAQYGPLLPPRRSVPAGELVHVGGDAVAQL